MKNQQVQSFIDKIKDEISAPTFPVVGWFFTLDDGSEKFDPYTQKAADIAGFPFIEGMPQPAGFFYVSDNYQAYLNALLKTQTEHPANTKKMEWAEGTKTIRETE